ncbi:hypothetical protein GKZ68_02190 [Hymenobacter sp. BRD128]|uniref:hypothetical protein n=1 Tax=Hymenobacter sp. BRD128 TaxID=2675878 RepID=UPI0015656C87|nr:hypothetical protein [Hymenobacter sp. BRD128]QKG55550.1 hypothetical protein GKZ68_02190 [Hymenobacter sp. BRD128]
MELDNLRRQWQQPEPAQNRPALGAAELSRLLAKKSGSIVDQLRRNARLELGINYALLLASLGLAALAPISWLRLFSGLLVLVALICIYYLTRKLSLLRSLDDPAGNLRAHLLHLTAGLRTLIRFYYHFTLAMLPISALVVGGLAVARVGAHVAPSRLLLVLGVVVGTTALCYWPVARATRWYLQRLYGQHLDRLEGQLRELDDLVPASPV